MKNRNVSFRVTGLFPSLLTCLFIYLKLTGSITWPWIWVVSPLWISFLMFVSLLVLMSAIYALLIRDK